MRNLILWIHIVAAGAWIGANFTQVLASRSMARAGGASEASWWRTTVLMSRVLYMPAAIISLLTGIELVRRGPWSYGDAFVLIGIAMVVVGALLGMLVYAPKGTEAAEVIDAGGDASALRSRLAAFGGLDTALLLFTFYAMVAKLGV